MESKMTEHEQRYHLNQVLNQSINGISHSELTGEAFNILIGNLERYGSVPGDDHKAALLEVLKAYTCMAQGVQQGRFAFPLATGMGKTQSIVAWVSALYSLGAQHVSLAVCASKVEALCDLKRDLIRQGVPEDAIGLLHSYRWREEPRLYDEGVKGEELPTGYASMPSTPDAGERQILLVTHSRVQGKGPLEQYHTWKGKPRNLLIWDESLFISDTRAASEIEIKSAVGWWKPRIGRDSDKVAVVAYSEQCIEVLDIELQKDGPQAMHLPSRTPEQIARYKQTIGGDTRLSELHTLLDISQCPLRVVNTPQRGGFITYDIAVPPELQNIIILDASHNIRELSQYDKSIQKTSRFSDNVVSYENVTVHQLHQASGRKSMEQSMGQARREHRLVSLEVAEVVKDIPQDQGIIIFTFKKRGKLDITATLKADLDALGINIEAKVPTGDTIAKPRFVWLTWGQETSLSQYQYCRNVIFAGVLHRSHVDLASCIVGQQDNLNATVTNDEIRQVERSEIAHCLYQAMSRGSCRVLKDSKAQPMQAWLIHKDRETEAWIKEVMPGVVWKEWEGVHLGSPKKERALRDAIAAFLKGLPESEAKISTVQVKRALHMESVPSTTFTRSGGMVSGEWTLHGRSFIRIHSIPTL